MMQDSSTSDMIWTIDELIEYLFAVITLEPGDVIATGTPHGVGMAMGLDAHPGEFSKLAEHMYAGGGKFLEDGDLLTSKIEGIGAVENRVIDLKLQPAVGS
jgi:2-keto-4-pentenoate hydratase/2-oxohepta-3-ene-1,7-dioic acid hydratase in catechol pathway